MEEGEAADDASDKLPGRGAKDKKIMVYYVTISTLLKGGSKAIDKIRRSLDTFSQNADSIEVVLYLQECITRDLERLDETLWQQLKDITDNLGINWKNCKLDTEGACLDYMDKWDGFYGDIGLLPRKCAEKRIPAMIQDVEI
jgi:hypothetical protein